MVDVLVSVVLMGWSGVGGTNRNPRNLTLTVQIVAPSRNPRTHPVLLLLDRRAKLQQRVRHLLAGLAQHVLQRAREWLLELRVACEERVRDTCLASTAGPANAMDVVLDGEGEGVVDDDL